MIVLEMKAVVKPSQCSAIDEAIRTVQFIRNKALRLWMDAKREDKIDKYSLNKYCAVLAKQFKFVDTLNSTARQASAERAWSAIARFYDNCKKKVKGKKGYPKFQKNNRSVEYKNSGWKLSEDRKKITFTDKKNIGTVKLKGTRDLNFYPIDEIKRVRIVKRVDGYYVQFCLSVDIREYAKPLEPTKKCVGLDVGLKVFYANSDGETVEIPQYYRQAEKRLNRLNRKKSKKFRKGQPQSNNYQKARKRYARKHLRISRQRKGFVEKEALRVIKSNDFIAYENLNIQGMVKNSKLAKSINDAAWSTFRQWLEYFGFKYGKATVAVPPHNTSQDCSNCGQKVPKSLSTRTHVCPHCGYVEDRDINAAINILKKGLSTVGHTETNTLGERFPLVWLDTSCQIKETQ
ncbi:MAG: transposase [Microcystis sp. M54BS1]|uniref:RNA-guided endonuclease InsQ/TnpB family protein n=1 Tax=unclassified Microcystis TaxID=2643300 RepID=UPI00257A2A69|nr:MULTISPECIES: transposase [unclassified Microcystis]MCA2539401.1 transposase [Microcystis sp. M54BS1]MCA2596725.1 transposase [Microcystis sp. M38BS1]MCA2608794.1 transposase [Microcystis sp. M27BS1]MCA2504735.1 transposase [Microcystis sp. M62BS1]MCA2510677.1 transposase [Microcystis sp. M60BS1]